MIEIAFHVAVWLFAAIVVFGAICFLVLDAMDKVESIKRRVSWIPELLKYRATFVGLLLICVVLLVGVGYDIMTKDIPSDISPISISFPSVDPKAKDSEITQLKWENDFLLHQHVPIGKSKGRSPLWHLSQDDRTKLIQALLPHCSMGYVALARYDPKDSDQFSYAHQIFDVFKGACNIELPRENAPNTIAEINSWDPFTGIAILVQSRKVEETKSHPPHSAVALHNAFAQLGFIEPIRYTEGVGKIIIVVGKKP